MHSHLIIGSIKKTKARASEIAPFKLENSIDCLMMEGEDPLGIDQVRKIKSFLQKKPYQQDSQIVFIESADRLTLQAQNAILKTLEEPPNLAMIILTTTNQNALLPTIISRCQLHQLTAGQVESDYFEDISNIIESITDSTVAQRVTLAQSYAYPVSKAKTFLQSMIIYLRSELQKNPSPNTTRNLKTAQETLTRIGKNVDPKLSLENFFIYLE